MLDQVAFVVRAAVVRPEGDTVRAGWNDRLRTGGFDTHDKNIGVVSFVGNKVGTRYSSDQIVRTLNVSELS